MTATDARPMRADARRNRERLLRAAVRAFAVDGPDASLEAIAKQAEVGIGTLYRHFPTREALVEAAYRSEVDRLCAASQEKLACGRGDLALRDWMGSFLEYMGTKKAMAETMRAVVATGVNPFAHTRDRMQAALVCLLQAGARDGTLRTDVEPGDVLATLIGIGTTAGGLEQREQAGRMLDLLMDGLRPRV